MGISLIISVYNDYHGLECVLNSLLDQSDKDFEIIIAHDNSDHLIETTLSQFTDKLTIRLFQQEDLGFRKNIILNKAITESRSEKLVFIDGDCMVHRHFIRNYVRCIRPGYFFAGRRLDVDQRTADMLRNKIIRKATIYHFFKHKTKRIEERLYAPCLPQKFLSLPRLLGCNMGWSKSDLIALNGFDTDYMHPGFGEDSDIEWRAIKLGLKPYSMRFKAIQFHLEHPRPNRKDLVLKGKNMMAEKVRLGEARCDNGIIKID